MIMYEGLLDFFIKKYQTYIDNLEWHMKTNKPQDKSLDDCKKKITTLTEFVNDLKKIK